MLLNTTCLKLFKISRGLTLRFQDKKVNVMVKEKPTLKLLSRQVFQYNLHDVVLTRSTESPGTC